MIHRTSEKTTCNAHMLYLENSIQLLLARYDVSLNMWWCLGTLFPTCWNSKKLRREQNWSKWGSNPRTFTRSRIIYGVAVPREVIPIRVVT